MLAYPAIYNVYFGQPHSHSKVVHKFPLLLANTVVPSACKIRQWQRYQLSRKDLDNGEMLL